MNGIFSEGFPERNSGMIVYSIENGNILSTCPAGEKFLPGNNLYFRLSAEDARMLREFGEDFSSLPVFCIIDGRGMILLRGMQRRFGIGVLLTFKESVEDIVGLIKGGKLDMIKLDESNMMCRSLPEHKAEMMVSSYNMALNAVYVTDVYVSVDDAIYALANFATCKIDIDTDAKQMIEEMSAEEKNNFLGVLFLLMLFTSREGKTRELLLKTGYYDGNKVLSFLTELFEESSWRKDEEITECVRLSDELDMFCRGGNVKDDSELIKGNIMRIYFHPARQDIALVGVKNRIELS